MVEFTKEALKPIKILSINVDEATKQVRLTVAEEELSKAIGRKGQNARLTSRLIGYDLIIEKDEHAQKVFEGQMGGAAHHLVEVLGITDAVAAKLAEGGFTDESVLAEVGVEEISAALDGNEELAREILAKVAALSASKENAPAAA
jgi:transcription termination/antitermination protein NusA